MCRRLNRPVIEGLSRGVALDTVVINEELDSVVEGRSATWRLFTQQDVEWIRRGAAVWTVLTDTLSAAVVVRTVHQTVYNTHSPPHYYYVPYWVVNKYNVRQSEQICF